jgi:ABC-type phosphate/phosphonate transport system substrate-binding protein
MAAEWVASLPMYDFRELRDAHDAFWDALAARLVTIGLIGATQVEAELVAPARGAADPAVAGQVEAELVAPAHGAADPAVVGQVATELAAAGEVVAGLAAVEVPHLPRVPRVLTRGTKLPEVWGSPRLLFAQGCEYPLAKAFGDRVRVVAHPIYSVAGCDGPRYRSAIVVRKDDANQGVPVAHDAGVGTDAVVLAGLRGRRCVVNELDSNSGMNLLRAAIAPLAHGESFFSSVAVSGSHLRSVEMVAAGEADVAAIDCVSFAHFQRLYPSLVAGVQVLSWTASTPSLPYITAGTASDETVDALRAALADVFDDSSLAHLRDRLLLRGVDFSPKEGYGEVLNLERAAVSAGYPILR